MSIFFSEIDNRRKYVYNIFTTSVRFKKRFEMNNLPQISEAEFEKGHGKRLCQRDQ